MGKNKVIELMKDQLCGFLTMKDVYKRVTKAQSEVFSLHANKRISDKDFDLLQGVFADIVEMSESYSLLEDIIGHGEPIEA